MNSLDYYSLILNNPPSAPDQIRKTMEKNNEECTCLAFHKSDDCYKYGCKKYRNAKPSPKKELSDSTLFNNAWAEYKKSGSFKRIKKILNDYGVPDLEINTITGLLFHYGYVSKTNNP